MTQVIFYSDTAKDILEKYDFSNLLVLPKQFVSLPKTRDNSLLVVNAVKSIILPLLPRELEDPKRLDLLRLLKEIHEHQFDLVDGSLTYYGEREKSEEVEHLEPTQLNLKELLLKKKELEQSLLKISKEIDTQLNTVWSLIDDRIKKLQAIQSHWSRIETSAMEPDTLDTLINIKDKLDSLNLPSVD